ncbi:hypothetical protein ABIA60_002407 [Pseudomonas frederiksbergensis]
MATMWPRSLPREVLESPLRAAEVRIYNCLKDALGAPFTVFYSRPWLGLTPTGAERDGECDFLVAHCDLGILALEVKGGAITYDPVSNNWTSRDRHGFVHRIKDPVAQARSAKYNILLQLRNSTVWHSRRIRAHHGVMLPDCAVPQAGLSAEAPRQLVCSYEDLHDLRSWILARMGAGHSLADGEELLGQDGLTALEDLLARPFMLKVPLGHQLAEDEHALQAMTPQQFHILEAIQDVPKAGIAGGAGTGKTVLALETARRFADAGYRTLLVCYNQPLAADLKRKLHGVRNIEAGSFHEICLQLANRAAIPFKVSEQASFFDETAPELVMEAVDTNPQLAFDAIVVDEGQDFRPLWWIALESLLRPGERSRLQVFYDCNQRVYDRGGRPPDGVELVPIRLTRNLRNTCQIHMAAMRHYVGHEILDNNLEGVEVEAVSVASLAAVLESIDAKIRELIGPERIPPCDIAVLTSSPLIANRIASNGRLAGELLCNATSPDDDAITVDTIRRFKGLERSVVVLLATPDLLETPELAYVALSRPRVLLYICGFPDVLATILKPKSLN